MMTIWKNKILHSDQFRLGRAPQLGENSNEREKKIGEPSEAV